MYVLKQHYIEVMLVKTLTLCRNIEVKGSEKFLFELSLKPLSCSPARVGRVIGGAVAKSYSAAPYSPYAAEGSC